MFDVVNNMEDYEDYFFKLKAPELVKGNKCVLPPRHSSGQSSIHARVYFIQKTAVQCTH